MHVEHCCIVIGSWLPLGAGKGMQPISEVVDCIRVPLSLGMVDED